MRLIKLIITLATITCLYLLWRNIPSMNSVPPPDVSTEGLHPLVAARIEVCLDAVRAEPDASESWGELAMVLIAHDFPDEARTCLLRASQLNPKEFRWPYFMANTYLGSDFEIARKYYRRSLDLNPSYSPLSIRMSQLLIRLGELEEAKNVLHEALMLESNNPYLLMTLGRLQLLQGDPDSARASFELAAEQSNWMPMPAYLELIKIAARDQNYDLAREYQIALASLPQVSRLEFPDPIFEEIRELEGLSKSEADQADFALARGDTVTAIVLYEKFVEKRDDLPTATTNLANAYGLSGRYSEAVATYERTLLKHDNYIPALMGLAATLNHVGRVGDAIAKYERVIQLKPDHAQAWLQLGMIYEQQKEWDDAIQCYQNAISVDPSFPQAELALGIMLRQKGRIEEARNHIERATRLAPGDPTPANYLRQIDKELHSTE